MPHRAFQLWRPPFNISSLCCTNDDIFITASGGSTLGYQQTGTPQFFLGGVGRLSAYGLNELMGNQYFVGRVGYKRKIFALPTFVGNNVYFTGFGEVGKMYGDPFGAPKLSGDGAVGVVAVTALVRCSLVAAQVIPVTTSGSSNWAEFSRHRT